MISACDVAFLQRKKLYAPRSKRHRHGLRWNFFNSNLTNKIFYLCILNDLIVKNYKRDREENKCYVYKDRVLYLITNNVK